MKEDICTIPISEVLEKHDGCPICRMRDELEERALEFIMGAAMMEPDVRHDTNAMGFCHPHFNMMLARKNRLSLALILESHLKEIDSAVFENHKPQLLKNPQKEAEKSGADAARVAGSCYVCARIDYSMDKLLNTFFKQWKNEPEFRKKVASQPFICLPHYGMLISKGASLLDKKEFAEFNELLSKVTRDGLAKLTEDVSGFCKMFDYRNNGSDFGETRDAVERSVTFLTGRRPL